MDWTAAVIVPTIFVGLPAVVLHHITRWKTAATLTNGDEALLDELYNLSRRLEDRLETVERLVAAEHPQFRPAARLTAETTEARSELDRLLAANRGVSR